MSEECVDIRDLRDGGFLWLDKEALDLVSRETGNIGVVVYSWLCYYANSKAQDCFPSVTTLSKRSHVSRRTVMRHLKRLEELGLISIQRIKGKSNIYRLLDVEKPVDKTGDTDVTSDTAGTGVVSVVSPPLVTPGTLEQELIKQELNNKTGSDFSFEHLFCGKLPYQKPGQERIKEFEDLCKELLGEVNLFKFILSYIHNKGYPPYPDVMVRVCKQFKKDKHGIKNVEGWFRRVVDAESAQFFANENIKEHKKYAREPTNIANILSGMEKGGER